MERNFSAAFVWIDLQHSLELLVVTFDSTDDTSLASFSCPEKKNSKDECSKCSFFQSHLFAKHKVIGCHKH